MLKSRCHVRTADMMLRSRFGSARFQSASSVFVMTAPWPWRKSGKEGWLGAGIEGPLRE